MKGLENKYIDLADYYKRELIKTSTNSPSRQNHIDQSVSTFISHSSKPGKPELPFEGEIFRTIIEEKKKLDEDMQVALNMKFNPSGSV